MSSRGSHNRQHLNSEDVNNLREAFNLFDTAQQGTINSEELRNVILSLGVDRKTPSTFSMLGALEAVRGRQLSFDDFLDLMASGTRDAEALTPEGIWEVFRLLDDEGRGMINVANLRRNCDELGLKLSTNELEEMISRADTDMDGEVSLADFKNIMSKKITR